MSYLPMKNVLMEVDGLTLEESDWDREIVHQQRLDELLALDTQLAGHDGKETHPAGHDGAVFTKRPAKARLHQKSGPSIPSFRAGNVPLSRSCNLPVIHSGCRDSQPSIVSDSELYFSKRSTSAPDIHHRWGQIHLPSIDTLQVEGHSPFPQEERQSLLASIKSTSRETRLNEPNPMINISPSHLTTAVDISFSLIAKQCFTTQTPGAQAQSTHETREMTIHPMTRRPNPTYQKYFKARFGRSLGTSHVGSVENSQTDMHNEHWVPLDKRGLLKTRDKVEALNSVMERIMRCRDKNGSHVTTSCDIHQCLSCSGVSAASHVTFSKTTSEATTLKQSKSKRSFGQGTRPRR